MRRDCSKKLLWPLLIFVVTLSFAPHGTSRDATRVDFDPFVSGSSDETPTLPASPADEGPTISAIGLNNNDIAMALQILSDYTGWSVFPTAEVSRAKISLWAKNISAQQLLDTIVTTAGFTYYREENIITVMTYDEYAQYHGLAKQVLTLEHASAASVTGVITPFLSKLGKSVVHEETNTIVLLDTQANLETIVHIIEKLDAPDRTKQIIDVLDLQYADAEAVAEALRGIFSETRQETTSARTPSPKQEAASGNEKPEAGMELRLLDEVSSPTCDVSVFAVGRTNQLIVKAVQSDIDHIRALVAKLDTFVEPTSRSYHFTYVDAAEVFSGLDQILDLSTQSGAYARGGTPGQQSTPQPRGVTLIEKTNSILLTAPPSIHRVMSSIVESIDSPSTYETGVIRIYKIENANVEEVAQVVRELLDQKQQSRQKPGEVKNTEGQPPRTDTSRYNASPSGGSAVGKPTGSADLGETEEFVPQVEARVAVSKATNSVIVQATGRQHRELEKLIEELDKRRRQVMIESRIVEVITSEGEDLGVELSYGRGSGYVFSAFGLSSDLDPTTGKRNIIVSPGGSAAVVDPDTVQALLKALKSTSNARIISAPRLLVNDNAVGFINSVAEEPITQINKGTVTDTVSFAGFVEAGTQFAITPHISMNDYLRVEYQITLNSFTSKSSDTSIPPPRNTSSIQSEATVPNGYSIIVGGLQASEESTQVDKVPLLGDVPLVGLAFRSKAVRKAHKTTYLFITPVIMDQEDFSDLKNLSVEQEREAERHHADATMPVSANAEE